MLGKWLCTKRNPSGIHKAISEVRQSWNVGPLHINCSRSTTSSERTSQPRTGDDCTWKRETVSLTDLPILRVLSQVRAAVPVVAESLHNISQWSCMKKHSHRRKSLTQATWEALAMKDNIKWVLSIKSQATVFTFPLRGPRAGWMFQIGQGWSENKS